MQNDCNLKSQIFHKFTDNFDNKQTKISKLHENDGNTLYYLDFKHF